jgi:hypothetical protein
MHNRVLSLHYDKQQGTAQIFSIPKGKKDIDYYTLPAVLDGEKIIMRHMLKGGLSRESCLQKIGGDSRQLSGIMF